MCQTGRVQPEDNPPRPGSGSDSVSYTCPQLCSSSLTSSRGSKGPEMTLRQPLGSYLSGKAVLPTQLAELPALPNQLMLGAEPHCPRKCQLLPCLQRRRLGYGDEDLDPPRPGCSLSPESTWHICPSPCLGLAHHPRSPSCPRDASHAADAAAPWGEWAWQNRAGLVPSSC